MRIGKNGKQIQVPEHKQPNSPASQPLPFSILSLTGTTAHFFKRLDFPLVCIHGPRAWRNFLRAIRIGGTTWPWRRPRHCRTTSSDWIPPFESLWCLRIHLTVDHSVDHQSFQGVFVEQSVRLGLLRPSRVGNRPQIEPEPRLGTRRARRQQEGQQGRHIDLSHGFPLLGMWILVTPTDVQVMP